MFMVPVLFRRVVMAFLIAGLSLPTNVAMSEERLPSAERMWRQLLTEAPALGLPTKFLKVVPPSFVRFEFDNLHSYAAEYHPGEHRMVLNRTLSFNGGATMVPPTGGLKQQ